MYYKLLKNNISKLNPTITSNFLNDKGINVNMDEAILQDFLYIVNSLLYLIKNMMMFLKLLRKTFQK